MAPSPGDERRAVVRRAVRLRILSALVLAPVALAAMWFGGVAFNALVVLAAGLMAQEWGRLADKGRWRAPAQILTALVTALALLGAATQHYALALALAAIATPPLYVSARRFEVAAPLWLAGGALILTAPCLALEGLRAQPEIGRALTIYVMVAVWATDTGGYIFGRWLGGPRLAPRISPNKTWAGLLGGMLCAGLAGAGVAWSIGAPTWAAGAWAAALAVVAQTGDLGESLFKRRMGVKDSGRLIPGHGGLLDRVDGLLTAAPAMALAAIAWRLFGGGSGW